MKKIKKTFKKLSLIFAFAVFSFSFSTFPINPAYALEEGEYSIYDYEWANYFDVSEIDLSLGLQYVRGADVSLTETGILFTPNDNTVSVNGPYVLSQVSGSYTLPVCPDLLNGENYTFSCDVIYSENGIVVDYSSFEFQLSIYAGSWTTFEFVKGGTVSYSYDEALTPDFTRMDLWFNNVSILLPALYDGLSIEISNIALYAGDEIFDYTPYFYDLEELPSETPDIIPNPDPPPVVPPIDDGSFDDGYEAGYKAGLGYSKYSFFYNARLRLSVLNLNGSIGATYDNVTIGFVDKGIALSPVIEFLNSQMIDTTQIAGVRLSIIFANPVPAQLFHVRGIGNVEAFANRFTLLTDLNVQYMGRFVEFEEPNIGFGIQAGVSSGNEEDALNIYKANFSAILDWDIYDINNLVGLTLLDYTADYDIGYGTGYNDGVEAGYDKGYDIGYDKGVENSYSEGYRVGYDDGFYIGITEDSGFLSLVTAIVDAPIHYMMSLFDFNILGYDMKGVFIGVLSACIIVAIISFFTKGKSE